MFLFAQTCANARLNMYSDQMEFLWNPHYQDAVWISSCASLWPLGWQFAFYLILRLLADRLQSLNECNHKIIAQRYESHLATIDSHVADNRLRRMHHNLRRARSATHNARCTRRRHAMMNGLALVGCFSTPACVARLSPGLVMRWGSFSCGKATHFSNWVVGFRAAFRQIYSAFHRVRRRQRSDKMVKSETFVSECVAGELSIW